MSLPKSDIDNVEKAFSKIEKPLEMVEEVLPKLDKASPTFQAQVSMLDIEPLKQVAGWYIDTAEDFADYGFALQESGMSWAQDTPWGHLFGLQASIARKLIGSSTMTARSLWQIPRSDSQSHQAGQHKA
jgi:hypothetical protein